MRSTYALAAALAACSTPPPPPQPPAVEVATPEPARETQWWCFEAGEPYRSQCNVTRVACAESLAVLSESFKLFYATCRPRVEAFCFLAYPLDLGPGAIPADSCHPTPEGCAATREDLAQKPGWWVSKGCDER